MKRLIASVLILAVFLAVHPVFGQEAGTQAGQTQAAAGTADADALRQRGRLCQDHGDYEKALSLYSQALEQTKAKSGEKSIDYVRCLKDLGDFYSGIGDTHNAIGYLSKAIELLDGLVDTRDPLHVSVLNSSACVLLRAHAYKEAKEILNKMVLRDLETSDSSVPLEAVVHGANLACACEGLGEWDNAKLMLTWALKYLEPLGGASRPEYVSFVVNLGTVSYFLGDYDDAGACFLDAIKRSDEKYGTDYPERANMLMMLGATLEANGQHSLAFKAVTRSLESQDKTLSNITRFTSEAEMQDYVSQYGGWLGVLVSMAASPAEYETAMTWALRRQAVVMDTMCHVHEAQQIMAGDPRISAKLAELTDARGKLANAQIRPGSKDQDAGLVDLRKRIDTIEGDINRMLPARLKSGQPSVDVPSIRKKLPPNCALVQFACIPRYNFRPTGKADQWAESRYYAFVLTPKGQAARIDLGPSDPIDKATAALRQGIEKTGQDFSGYTPDRIRKAEKGREVALATLSRDLCKRVLTPLRPALGKATRVFISPDGELSRLAFETLMDGSGGYAIEHYKFTYLSSGRDLLRPAAKVTGGVCVFAGPDYDLDSKTRQAKVQVASAAKSSSSVRGLDVRGLKWDSLAGAAEEGALVTKALTGGKYGPVKVWQGRDALEENLKSVVSPRVLHIATHGFFLPDMQADRADLGEIQMSATNGAAVGLARLRQSKDPLLRSGLVMAGANRLDDTSTAVDDGWVTAEEIASMNLQGTELVVLSACESGLGDVEAGDGVSGLRRAFMYAGARTLVTSMFKVPDAETRQLMGSFYSNLKKGQSKSDALRNDQLQMIAQRRKANGAAHPFFWGSFVLIGDPN